MRTRMMVAVVLSSVLLLSTANAAPVPMGAPATFVGTGNMYQMYQDTAGIGWIAAEAYASSTAVPPTGFENGHLASILTAAENAFVVALRSTVTGGTPSAWLGGNDITTTNMWEWSDGSGVFWIQGGSGLQPGFFAAWGGGEPNGGNVAFPGGEWSLELRADGLWNDLSTQNQSWFVAEFTPIPVPEPATAGLALMGLGGLVGAMRRRRIA